MQGFGLRNPGLGFKIVWLAVLDSEVTAQKLRVRAFGMQGDGLRFRNFGFV